MNSNKISKLLRRYFYTHDYKLHNQYIFEWESDFFCITQAGYTVECEIKISKSDFKADFKKKKKHGVISGVIDGARPNKFYYVAPIGIISTDEIPSYAGLIVISETGSLTELKKAPYIHKDKPDIRPILLSKYYNLSLSIFNKLLKFRSEFSYGLQENKKRELDEFINKFHFDI